MRRALLIAALALVVDARAQAATPVEIRGGDGEPITIVVRDTPIAEVFEMLARQERVNIVVGKDVEGRVSVSLYDVTLDHAVRAIAEAAGYVAERRRGAYIVLDREEAGKDAADGNTIVKSLKVQYSDPVKVAEILEKHLSRYGELTVLEARRLIVVEDLPGFIYRMRQLLREIDREPSQVLIEAKILEITLDESETYGINWTQFLQDGEAGDIGVQGLSTLGSPGFFFDYIDPENLNAAMNALADDGRVRTLSTPTLLALEHEESEVVIGDRLGFRVTTTINQVTTESVEFLESGVILKFKAAVDSQGRVLLEIHPEVSSGVINDGLPSQTTAEVTTKLLAEDGQTVFIGGLLKDRIVENHSGAPYLKDIPILGWLFSRREDLTVSTETVVVVTCHVVGEGRHRASRHQIESLEQMEHEIELHRRGLEMRYEPPGETAPSGDPSAPPAAPDEAQP